MNDEIKSLNEPREAGQVPKSCFIISPTGMSNIRLNYTADKNVNADL